MSALRYQEGFQLFDRRRNPEAERCWSNSHQDATKPSVFSQSLIQFLNSPAKATDPAFDRKHKILKLRSWAA